LFEKGDNDRKPKRKGLETAPKGLHVMRHAPMREKNERPVRDGFGAGKKKGFKTRDKNAGNGDNEGGRPTVVEA